MKSKYDNTSKLSILEEKLSPIIESLQNNPPKTKEILCENLLICFSLMNSIEDDDLLSFLFKYKTLEWLLQTVLLFKSKYIHNDDTDLELLIKMITEQLLVNIKASLMCSLGASAKLPDIVEKHINVVELRPELQNKFNRFFNLYVSKCGENDTINRIRQLEHLTNLANHRADSRPEELPLSLKISR